MFDESFYWLLSNAEPIKQVVGTPETRADATTGIFPDMMPEAASLPAVVYTTISEEAVNSLDGTNALSAKRLQVDVYGKSAGTVNTVIEQLKEVILGFRGALLEGIVFTSVIMNSQNNSFESTPWLHRGVLDLTIWYQNPITEPFPVPEPPPDMDLVLDGGTF